MQHIIGCYLFQLANTKCGSFPWPPKCSSLIHCRTVAMSICPPPPFVQLFHCPSASCLSVPLSPLVDRHRASRSLARLFHLTENAMIFHVHFTHFEFEIFLNARFHSKTNEHWVFFFGFHFGFGISNLSALSAVHLSVASVRFCHLKCLIFHVHLISWIMAVKCGQVGSVDDFVCLQCSVECVCRV